jgi:hypothetical protein
VPYEDGRDFLRSRMAPLPIQAKSGLEWGPGCGPRFLLCRAYGAHCLSWSTQRYRFACARRRLAAYCGSGHRAHGCGGRLDIGAGSIFPQHLLNGISGNEMDQQENHRHNEPNDGNHVKQAGYDVAKHGTEYGSKEIGRDRRDRRHRASSP